MTSSKSGQAQLQGIRPRSLGDEVLSEADQTASDTDQTASDTDQTASERDDSLSAADQRSSDRDQASAQADGSGSDEVETKARQASTAERRATHAKRTEAASSRAAAAVQRDRMADQRDANAAERDRRAMVAVGPGVAADRELIERFEKLRAEAAAFRTQAAAERARVARERIESAASIARLEDELEHAHLDELTGAYRREMGWVVLAHEVERARRDDDRLALAFVDVVGLKEVNDSDGHAAGDHVLQTLVETMRGNLRSFDPIVRYGGDEFVCGLGGIDEEDARKRFRLIDRSLRQTVGTGISTGIAMLSPDETLEAIVDRADVAMLAGRKSLRGRSVPRARGGSRRQR